MATKAEVTIVFEHWLSKDIVAHKRLTQDMNLAIRKLLKDYTVDEVKETIDVYAVVLEPGVAEEDKKYWWSFKWNLLDFMSRGFKKFFEQEPSNFKKKQQIKTPESVTFKRK